MHDQKPSTQQPPSVQSNIQVILEAKLSELFNSKLKHLTPLQKEQLNSIAIQCKHLLMYYKDDLVNQLKKAAIKKSRHNDALEIIRHSLEIIYHGLGAFHMGPTAMPTHLVIAIMSFVELVCKTYELTESKDHLPDVIPEFVYLSNVLAMTDLTEEFKFEIITTCICQFIEDFYSILLSVDSSNYANLAKAFSHRVLALWLFHATNFLDSNGVLKKEHTWQELYDSSELHVTGLEKPIDIKLRSGRIMKCNLLLTYAPIQLKDGSRLFFPGTSPREGLVGFRRMPEKLMEGRNKYLFKLPLGPWGLEISIDGQKWERYDEKSFSRWLNDRKLSINESRSLPVPINQVKYVNPLIIALILEALTTHQQVFQSLDTAGLANSFEIISKMMSKNLQKKSSDMVLIYLKVVIFDFFALHANAQKSALTQASKFTENAAKVNEKIQTKWGAFQTNLIPTAVNVPDNNSLETESEYHRQQYQTLMESPEIKRIVTKHRNTFWTKLPIKTATQSSIDKARKGCDILERKYEQLKHSA